MKCPLCRGRMGEGQTIVPYELDRTKIIVVAHVPAWICEQCGENFIEMAVVRDLECIVEKTGQGGLNFGIVEYRRAA